jgi:hypothetical protein
MDRLRNGREHEHVKFERICYHIFAVYVHCEV